ncbi:hypothetical protein DV736_g4744, partial [Chaetothyriales sp. CBS 134916]
MAANQHTGSASTRHALGRADPRWKLKLSLYILTLLASLIAVSLFAAIIPEWNANFFHTAGPIRGDWTDGLPLGPLGLALISTLAMLLYTVIKRKSPSPTRATVALYAFILIFLAPSLVLSGVGSLFRFWQPPAVASQSGVIRCNLTNIFTRQCQPVLYQVGRLQIAGLVFGSITWVLVFISLLVHLYDQRAMSLSRAGMGGSSARRGLRRLTMMTGRAGRRHDLEKGDAWVGSDFRYPATSEGNGSRPSDRARYGDRRSLGTRRQYRVASSQGGEDIMPLATPMSSYRYPATRYM